jgi:ABC-2 type transport system ATP-binding protein
VCNEAIMSQPVVETRDLSKHYGSAVGIEGLELRIEEGEVFGLLGPNGAGKTTTLRLLLDLIRPTRGEARLLGRPAADPAARRSVGYLPGELHLDPRLAGNETLDLLGRLSAPEERADEEPTLRAELVEQLGLSAEDLERPVRDYSRGMKQKIGIIAALQHRPRLLILDEPTTGLDPLIREVLLDLLRQAGREGRTVLCSSHVLSEVDRCCSRVAVIRDGHLVVAESVATLRRSIVRRMSVRFAGPVPMAELELPGIKVMEHSPEQVVLRVGGPLTPLLRVLARHPVEDLVFPEPSLDEAFAHLYGRPGGTEQ